MTNSDRMARALEREANTSAIEALRAVMIEHGISVGVTDYGETVVVYRSGERIARAPGVLTAGGLML